ncbi:unnamed protein product [Paramecium pentaurelia]|uniref:Uncharacterized protein n=1 Tax=Paramecium pentaurelia TaxID=43138 RepID=A0A8S1VYV3_9CILI|nr:unnamed protein product [Paramecium pentaurelia]
MNTSLIARFQNSAVVYYAQRGWYWTNRVGKLNILTAAAIWYIFAESSIAGKQRPTFYRHNWIQNPKPSRVIFEDRS